MQTAGNSIGGVEVDLFSEMRDFDTLPPAVRRALCEVAMPIGSANARHWLEQGYSDAVIAHAIKITDQERRKLAALVFYGPDHPEAHPAPSAKLLREYGFVEEAASFEIEASRARLAA